MTLKSYAWGWDAGGHCGQGTSGAKKYNEEIE